MGAGRNEKEKGWWDGGEGKWGLEGMRRERVVGGRGGKVGLGGIRRERVVGREGGGGGWKKWEGKGAVLLSSVQEQEP